MGCLDKSNSSDKNNNSVIDDKDYEWFLSQHGRALYEQTMVPRNFIQDDEYYEEYENQDELEYYSSYVYIHHRGFKSPRLYFDQLVSAMGDLPGASDCLQYVGPIERVSNMTRINAENYYYDDDGNPVADNEAYGYEDIVDKENNPILRFAFEFNALSFKDESIPFEKKYALLRAALLFVAIEFNRKQQNILEFNPWLFEKSTYLSLGMPMNVKGFWKIGMEKSTNREYCKEQYEKEE